MNDQCESRRRERVPASALLAKPRGTLGEADALNWSASLEHFGVGERQREREAVLNLVSQQRKTEISSSE